MKYGNHGMEHGLRSAFVVYLLRVLDWQPTGGGRVEVRDSAEKVLGFSAIPPMKSNWRKVMWVGVSEVW